MTINTLVADRRAECQHKVELMPRELVHQFLHRPVAHVELHLMIFLQEIHQRFGGYHAEGERNTDIQFAHKHGFQLL